MFYSRIINTKNFELFRKGTSNGTAILLEEERTRFSTLECKTGRGTRMGAKKLKATGTERLDTAVDLTGGGGLLHESKSRLYLNQPKGE